MVMTSQSAREFRCTSRRTRGPGRPRHRAAEAGKSHGADRRVGRQKPEGKGAKPADPPPERPARFALLVNLKTAKALPLKVPASVGGRANRVIRSWPLDPRT